VKLFCIIRKILLHNDKNHHLGIDIMKLVDMCNEKSYQIPRGLNRYERREYCKKLGEKRKMNKFSLFIESVLDFDDSEFSYEFLGYFNYKTYTKEEIEDAINSYWRCVGEDVMTPLITEKIIHALEHNIGYIDFLEIDETVDFESCRRRFTVRIE
jgi:hypothetical protein